MSDCGVCVDGYDGEDGVYFGMKVVRSRKDRQCDECGKLVPHGTPIAYHRGKGDNMWQSYCCLTCDEIANTFCCNGRLFGSFWDDMWDCYEALNTACFERLTSVAAKTELRERWITWKFGSQHRREARRRVESMVAQAKKELSA